MSQKRRSQVGLSPAERRELGLKELGAEWDRRLSILNKPDAHKRFDAVFAGERPHEAPAQSRLHLPTSGVRLAPLADIAKHHGPLERARPHVRMLRSS